MKSFAIELQDETVEILKDIWRLKNNGGLRNALQQLVESKLAEILVGQALEVWDDKSKVSQDR